MQKNIGSIIIKGLSKISDPRYQPNCEHLLADILTLVLIGFVCGCNGWDEIHEFGNYHKNLLKKFLILPNGIPSPDTIRRVMAKVDPQELNRLMITFTENLRASGQEFIHFDGKTARHSYDHAINQSALHVLTAWSSTSQLILGQMDVDKKENEIVVLPKLMALLDIRKSIVTIDAIGCQESLAREINLREGDYLLAVKDNQPHLAEDLKEFFDYALQTKFEDLPHQYYHEVTKDHGRIEKREYYVVEELSCLRNPGKWHGLKSLIFVIRERKVGGKISIERAYYISSCKANAKLLGRAIRNHWQIETSVHWVLDMTFEEDECRIRRDNGPKNVAIMRRLAINILKRDKESKKSMRRRRKISSWDPKYGIGLMFS